jgi:polar amino acid transport system substrate-binding protein
MRLSAAVAASALAALVLAACGGSGSSTSSTSAAATSSSSSSAASTTSGGGGGKTYVVATSADFPPLSSRSATNASEVVGFEPDMTKALMDHLGWKYKTVTSDFNGLIPSVQSGRVDMVISDVYDTSERRAVVDFVDYLSNNFSIMVRGGDAAKVKSFLDLCGKPMGILTGSAPEVEAAKAGSKQCTDAGKPAITIRSYPAVAQELPPLSNGTIDAILETNVSLAYIEKQQHGKYKLVFDVPGNKTNVGIVLKKNSPIEAKIKEAVQWYIGTPQYAQNAKKWGLPTSALLKSGA